MNCLILTPFVIARARSINKISRAIVQLALVAFVLFGAETLARAQDPSSTPVPTATPTAEEVRLQEENRLLELKKNNAALKKEIRESQPKASTTPLEGDTTADENVVIETQMVTYKAMSDIADRIGAEIHQKFGSAKAIAIYDADELENLKRYRATSPILEGRIKDLKDRYRKVLESLDEIPLLATSKGSSVQPKSVVSQSNVAIAESVTNAVTTSAATVPFANFVGPAAAITEGLKVFADLLALMRTDTDIKGKSVSVEESAMVAETFRALRNRFRGQVNLYYPEVVSPEGSRQNCETELKPVFCSKTLKGLAELYVQKNEADEKLLQQMFDVTGQFDMATGRKSQAESTITAMAKQIADLKLDRLKAELAKPWTLTQTARFQTYIKELETMKSEAAAAKNVAESVLEHYGKRKNVLEQLQSLNQQAEQLVANLAKVDEKTGRTELANFLRAENMDDALGENGYWLAFRSISAGGNNRTRKNLFRYFSGAKLDHSGGLIVEWALYDRKGVSVDSNKDSSYGGYVAPKEIQGAKFKDAVADPAQAETQSRSLASSKNQ